MRTEHNECALRVYLHGEAEVAGNGQTSVFIQVEEWDKVVPS